MPSDALKLAKTAQSSGFTTDWDRAAQKHKSKTPSAPRSGVSQLGCAGHHPVSPYITAKFGSGKKKGR